MFGPLGGILGGLGGHSEPSWGRFGASWRHVGDYFGPSCGILSHLGGHPGLFRNPLGAILGQKESSDTSRGSPSRPIEEGG
eukprot:4302367-Pyramimonas_sp.AAC.1